MMTTLREYVRYNQQAANWQSTSIELTW